VAIVRKFTIGVLPIVKMFRMNSLGGVAIDQLLRLRLKELPEDYFTSVSPLAPRMGFVVHDSSRATIFSMTEESISFTKDYFETDKSFDFKKVLEEFKLVWSTINSVLKVQDIRRIGMVAEYRLSISEASPSDWLRDKFIKWPSDRYADKVRLNFEERGPTKDGKPPNQATDDFINYIYTLYDGVLDAQHPSSEHMFVNLDVQRYFSPVLNGRVEDEVLKLHQHFAAAQLSLDSLLKGFGAKHA
jgi:hypothetical protein